MGDFRQWSQDPAVLLSSLGYPGIFLTMLIEGSGLPLPFPGVLFLAFIGYAAWRGYLDLAGAAVAGAVGFSVGSSLLYRVAQGAGSRFLPYLGRRLTLAPERVRDAQSKFNRYSIAATFVSRFTPGARVYISVAAGLARMRQLPFLVCTFAGSLVWITVIVFMGWSLGESWRDVSTVMAGFDLVVPGALGVLAVLVLAWRRRGGAQNHRF